MSARSNVFLITFLVVFTLGGCTTTAEDFVDMVKATVTKLNLVVAEHSLMEMPLPDRNASLLKVGSLHLTNGHLGKFSSLVVRRETDQHMQKIVDEDGASHYIYDVSLGLEELRFRFDYSYRWLLVFLGNGVVTIDANINTARLTGIVTNSTEGKCTASLSSAAFALLSGYEVTLEPEGFINTFVGYASQMMINHFMDSAVIQATNNYIQKVVNTTSFQTTYSEILCESFGE